MAVLGHIYLWRAIYSCGWPCIAMEGYEWLCRALHGCGELCIVVVVSV